MSFSLFFPLGLGLFCLIHESICSIIIIILFVPCNKKSYCIPRPHSTISPFLESLRVYIKN